MRASTVAGRGKESLLCDPMVGLSYDEGQWLTKQRKGEDNTWERGGNTHKRSQELPGQTEDRIPQEAVRHLHPDNKSNTHAHTRTRFSISNVNLQSTPMLPRCNAHSGVTHVCLSAPLRSVARRAGAARALARPLGRQGCRVPRWRRRPSRRSGKSAALFCTRY